MLADLRRLALTVLERCFRSSSALSGGSMNAVLAASSTVSHRLSMDLQQEGVFGALQQLCSRRVVSASWRAAASR